MSRARANLTGQEIKLATRTQVLRFFVESNDKTLYIDEDITKSKALCKCCLEKGILPHFKIPNVWVFVPSFSNNAMRVFLEFGIRLERLNKQGTFGPV